MTVPNEYTFHGDGIQATWIPDGAGPVTEEGRVTFSYSDGHQSKVFRDGETAVVALSGIGTLVTVVLAANDISHSQSSFSVLVPEVGVDDATSQTFRTKGFTTAQGASLVKSATFPALQTYKVEQLLGTARIADIAD